MSNLPVLSGIRLLLLDVDGVLTDGRIIYDSQGVETKAFDVKDGHGLKLLRRAGLQIGLITGRSSPVTRQRAEELQAEFLYQNAKDKREALAQVLEQSGLQPQQVAYVGDDLVDLPVLQQVGFAVAVADAVPEVKTRVHYVTARNGGCGAVREVCELLLRHQGLWGDVVARYYDD